MPEPTEQWELPVSFGVNGKTGQLLPGIDEASFVAFCKEQPGSDTNASLTGKDHGNKDSYGANRTVVKDPNDLRQAGWGVIFSKSVTSAKEAELKRLLTLREEQAGDRYRIFRGEDSFLESDVDAHGWLARLKLPLQLKPVKLSAPINPKDGVPLYLLIVAPPEDISFEFQYQLSLQFFVGRLWFETAKEFAQYVDSVLRYEDEKQPVSTARQAALFAPMHYGDTPTTQFNKFFADPVSQNPDLFPGRNYALRKFTADDATRDNLQAILSGDIPNGTPALLISGSHGVNFDFDPSTDVQALSQGAILCQDWPGIGEFRREDVYFDASRLSSDARLHGMIHFFFACHSAGWPRFDNFAARDSKPIEIAPKPGLARLPQAMLAHPKGGALAVIGHIDRAWPNSFLDPNDNVPVLGTFDSVIDKVLAGDRIGQAMDDLSSRWAKVAAMMFPEWSDWHSRSKRVPESGFEMEEAKKLCEWWTAHHDARNYVIIGDPAVRLREKAMPLLEEVSR